MEIKLAQNIKNFRKERGLTQEQLAEILDLSVGAIYKWEAGLSIPELGYLLALAGLFECSVDYLLGYRLQEKQEEALAQQLQAKLRQKDLSSIELAEQALRRYPHSFLLHYRSAVLYQAFGSERKNKAWLERALALFSTCLAQLPKEPQQSLTDELSLQGHIADLHLALGQLEQALAIWKAHNTSGLFSDRIGQLLASHYKNAEEALPYLSQATLTAVVILLRVVIGQINLSIEAEQYEDCITQIRWGLDFVDSLKKDQNSCFVDKICIGLLACLAYCHWALHTPEEAENTLKQAHALAISFDKNPNYSPSSLHFMEHCTKHSAFDDLGVRAKDALYNSIDSLENPTFSNFAKALLDT